MTIREHSVSLKSALRWRRALLPACILALALAVPELPAAGQAGPPPMPGDDAAQPSDGPDPPARVGRLSYISGTVSFHTLDEDQWEPAVVNYPVTEGVSFWTEPGSRASLQLGNGVARLDGSTEVDVQQLNDQAVQLNVPQGTINFRLRGLGQDETYQIATPSGTVALTSPGRFHVDAGANGAPGSVTVFEGTAQLVGDNGGGMTIQSGQSVALSGSLPLPPPQPAQAQDFDSWSDQQEAQVAQAPEYVSPDMPGVDDLGGQGNWDRAPDYGPVWYPPVQVGWAPYRYGHWAFVPPWGWTWIDDAPWGFAPFHYGRWAEIGGRWGWIPGERRERPVYAPALVAFVGGGGLAVSIGVGPVVGWVPLGPREVYVPPYRGSIEYIRRVNVTNVTNVNNITITNINTYRSGGNAAHFANVSAATVVRPEAMSGSARISTAAVKVPPSALSTATVSNQPAVKPTSATVGAGPTVVKALGGNVNTTQQRAHAPGPQVQAKPLPATLIKPLTTTPSATGGATAPGPKISTPTAGAGTGTNANTNNNAGNKGTGASGPNNRFAPAAGAGTGTNTNANTNTNTNANTGNKGTGAPGPNNRFAPASGAGTGTNTNTNTNTNANTGNKGTGAPGPNNRFPPAAGAGTNTNTNANTNANTGNKGTGAPGPNNRFTPAAGAGAGTNPNANTNTNANTGNKGTGAPGPNNRFTPSAGPGTGTNTNTNANTNTGNKGTGAPGPNNRFAPTTGAGTKTNTNTNANTGNQPNKTVNQGQNNPPKPPAPPPPQQGGNKTVNANGKPKCDPKVQKCP